MIFPKTSKKPTARDVTGDNAEISFDLYTNLTYMAAGRKSALHGDNLFQHVAVHITGELKIIGGGIPPEDLHIGE